MAEPAEGNALKVEADDRRTGLLQSSSMDDVPLESDAPSDSAVVSPQMNATKASGTTFTGLSKAISRISSRKVFNPVTGAVEMYSAFSTKQKWGIVALTALAGIFS